MTVPKGHPLRAHAGWEFCAWCRARGGSGEADLDSFFDSPRLAGADPLAPQAIAQAGIDLLSQFQERATIVDTVRELLERFPWANGPATHVAFLDLRSDGVEAVAVDAMGRVLTSGGRDAAMTFDATLTRHHDEFGEPLEGRLSAALQPDVVATAEVWLTRQHDLDRDLAATTTRLLKTLPPPADPDNEVTIGPGHVYQGVTFSRRRDGVYPNEPQAIRFQANRPLSDHELQRLGQIVGYNYRAEVRGEPTGSPIRDSDRSFIVHADTTKSRSDDVSVALERFESALSSIVADGSPIRKTDRAGAGTAGTRLVTGLGPNAPTLSIWYDDVVKD
ncbi:MAG: hypothetical protein ACSLE6_12220 [Mycobacterium sp.]